MIRRMCAFGAVAAFAAFTSPTLAGDPPQAFFVTMNGANEVPGPGDSAGSASGLITLNPATGEISWDFAYMNLMNVVDTEDIIGFHIHPGAAGASGGVLVNLGTANNGLGSLVGSVIAPLTDVNNILDNPEGFYLNIHTPDFTAGAVRGQIPAPTTLGALALGAATIVIRRRAGR